MHFGPRRLPRARSDATLHSSLTHPGINRGDWDLMRRGNLSAFFATLDDQFDDILPDLAGKPLS